MAKGGCPVKECPIGDGCDLGLKKMNPDDPRAQENGKTLRVFGKLFPKPHGG